jgi:predicted Zn-dependent peptidase
LPAVNIEIALMVESDRMRNIKISNKIFEREKNVVLEEYKETCLNKPYGDSFHLISKLAYKTHPYRWPVIGMNEKSISKLMLNEAIKFYKTYYQPANAILSINSNVEHDILFGLIEKYFGSIPSTKLKKRRYPTEPPHTTIQHITAKQKAPADAIYMAFNMADRSHKDFYVADVISDILSNGHSTRLLRNLLRGKKMVSNIDAYITASLDPGLFIIEAKLIPGKSMKVLETNIWKELGILKKNLIRPRELTKIKNTIDR